MPSGSRNEKSSARLGETPAPATPVARQVLGGPVVGPAAAPVGMRFDPFSERSLDVHYVQALVGRGFGCNGLSTDHVPWLPPVLQARLRALVSQAGLRVWQTGGGHALDGRSFSHPKPRWNAARAYHVERIQWAQGTGLEGCILSPPPDAVATLEENEAHLAEIVRLCPGGLWISNTANAARRTGTAQQLTDLCRATGARPCYNAPAHILRSRLKPSVDAHKEALRELGPDLVIRYGNLIVQGGDLEWGPYEASNERLAAPLKPLVQALQELKRTTTPILVEGRQQRQDAANVLQVMRDILGLDSPGLAMTG